MPSRKNNSKGEIISFLKAKLGLCVRRSIPTASGYSQDILRLCSIASFIFSIFAKIVADWLPFSAIIKWIMIGLLEITTGASMIAHAPLAECIKDAALVSLCAFGGFSGAAQTASVISNTDLSVRRYLYVKFRQAVIAGILALVLFSVF